MLDVKLKRYEIEEVITKEEFLKKCMKICCFCRNKYFLETETCGYHSRCGNCGNKKMADCKLCIKFQFKPLRITCCNCKEKRSLYRSWCLSCSHRLCYDCKNNKKVKKDIHFCSICKKDCPLLPVNYI